MLAPWRRQKEVVMQLARSIFLGAALALAFVPVHAADDKDAPGFNELDKDDDGALTRREAGGNAVLLARFKEVDSDGDGKLSRLEYLKIMARKDFNTLRGNVADFIDPDEEPSAGGAKPAR
jgi:hypothetical protein